MSIGSIGQYGSTMMNASMGPRPPKPEASEIADTLFSKLDKDSQGYIEVSDLENAFANMESDTSASASEVFEQFDNNLDGKVTKEELTSGLKALEEELNSQFDAMRMGGMSNMPPPPPPPESGDQGFNQEELSEIAETTSDSQLSDLMSSLASNFEAADADHDGRVTHEEAMAYQNSTETDTTETASASEAATSSDILRTILDLMRAYGTNTEQDPANRLSVRA